MSPTTAHPAKESDLNAFRVTVFNPVTSKISAF